MSNLENVVGEFLTLLGYMRDNFFRPAEQITRLRISHGQFHAISILCQKGALPMTELASEMKVSKQQLTPLICKLIETNFVARKPDENDRRIVRIEVTEAGKEMFKELRIMIKQQFTEKISGLSEPELDELEQMLIRIRQILSRIE